MENRQHKRVNCSLSLRYKTLGQKDAVGVGSFAENISIGGIRVKSKTFMQLSSHIVLNISISALSQPAEVISKVAWIKKSQSQDQYEIGVHFVEMTEEDSINVRDFINRI